MALPRLVNRCSIKKGISTVPIAFDLVVQIIRIGPCLVVLVNILQIEEAISREVLRIDHLTLRHAVEVDLGIVLKLASLAMGKSTKRILMGASSVVRQRRHIGLDVVAQDQGRGPETVEVDLQVLHLAQRSVRQWLLQLCDIEVGHLRKSLLGQGEGVENKVRPWGSCWAMADRGIVATGATRHLPLMSISHDHIANLVAVFLEDSSARLQRSDGEAVKESKKASSTLETLRHHRLLMRI